MRLIKKTSFGSSITPQSGACNPRIRKGVAIESFIEFPNTITRSFGLFASGVGDEINLRKLSKLLTIKAMTLKKMTENPSRYFFGNLTPKSNL
jgi:hypothetical protein